MSTGFEDIRLLKKQLRKEMKAKVSLISDESKIQQSEIVAEKILQSEHFRQAKAISLYLHMQDEIRTEQILKEALQDGKTCFIPRCY